MKEYLSSWSFGVLALILFGSAMAQTQPTAIPSTHPRQTTQSSVNHQTANFMDHSLRLTVTVDNPSFLLVKEGAQVTVGDTITDNKLERDRLKQQRQSVELHIQNLESKTTQKPLSLKLPPPVKSLPPANYAEEETTIAMAQLRFMQAQHVLESRRPFLNADNPEHKAETEKALAVLQQKSQKVENQKQLLEMLKNEGMQANLNPEERADIIEHETVILQQLQNERKQAKADLGQAKGKLKTSGVEQQQQLQQLQLAVKSAQSELDLAKSRLSAAKTRRRQLEYDTSVKAIERSQQTTQLQQEYYREQQTYAQATRDRDYQLAQLNLSLSAIDDKLSQIPIVRSPKNGYIRRIKPWVGNNGKYSTTIVISSTPNTKSSGRVSNNTSITSNDKQQPAKSPDTNNTQ